MDTSRRMKLIGIIGKIEKYPTFSERLNIKDISVLEREDEKNESRRKENGNH